MRYTFKCIGAECDHTEIIVASIKDGPPEAFECDWCGDAMERDLLADLRTVQIDTSGCRDHDHIPETHRVASNGGFGIGRSAAERRTAAYQRHIQQRRGELRDGNRGSIRQTHSVPTDLYWGKIRQTGDKDYWRDPQNVKKHNSTKVG